MARADWQQEIDEFKRRDHWSLHGRNRPVKVIGLPNGPVARLEPVGGVSGYFTVAYAIAGLTPPRIERALGLKVDSLKFGAVIYTLKRLPQASEYVYELTADKPDGLEETFMSDPRFPVGDGKIHQWRILHTVTIPVDSASAVQLSPSQVFGG